MSGAPQSLPQGDVAQRWSESDNLWDQMSPFLLRHLYLTTLVMPLGQQLTNSIRGSGCLREGPTLQI